MPEAWRKMWVLVFYDLPVTTPAERRAATGFHHFLVREGYERLHFSVYSRYCGSLERAQTFERRVEAALPARGYICLMRLTDRQMTNMRRWIRGGYRPDSDAESAPPEQYQLF